MRIAISAMEPGLSSQINPRFGRSEYFILVEPETMHFETLRNPNQESSSGTGISTAQLICNKGVGMVITGAIGPKAHQVLSAAGVRMLTGVNGKVGDAIERFKTGKLPSESGSGELPKMREGASMGRGMGAGGGRGMGMGRGMGRGMGCGGGKGMGMGPGQGGCVAGSSPGNREAEPWSERGMKPSGQDELALLKQQANALADELTRIHHRIEQMEKK